MIKKKEILHIFVVHFNKIASTKLNYIIINIYKQSEA